MKSFNMGLRAAALACTMSVFAYLKATLAGLQPVHIVQTEAEKEALARFRYDVYVNDLYLANYPGKWTSCVHYTAGGNLTPGGNHTADALAIN